ncbi:homing endonuclease associated repeat-containing protein [Salinirubrum litoreum]|uniref:Homing endonuclease associated repeat-containing protein n=1 Tax=Salinirubrum litoreum TaxID=1126234 RepID=A0ABD5REK0_9EURY|nr:HNH endonuclease [Salinirubrum litoreum]
MTDELDAETLLDALIELAEELGETPTRTQMNEFGRYSHAPYYRVFGSWNDALRAAGLTTNHENDVAREALVAELRRLDDELDRLPRFDDMEEYGEYSGYTYLRRFGSWSEAKEAAGLAGERRTSRRITESELVDALLELAEVLGRAPTQVEMNELGEFSQRPYYRVWGSWADALEAAGLDANHRNDISNAKLIAELRRLDDELGHAPREEDMREDGVFSVQPYITAFGSWTAAWDAAGLEYRTRYPASVSREALIDAIHSLADELGYVPSREDMIRDGAYSRTPFEYVFGSWSAALEAAGFRPYRITDTDSEYVYYGSDWPAQRERALDRDEWQCQRCGMTNAEHLTEYGSSLHVHHIRKLVTFEDSEEANRLENLQTVCRDCHAKVERRSHE